MTEKQISVRISATGGDKLQAQLKGVGMEGARAFATVGKSASASRFALQNAAYQVQDVFVQVAAGTDVSRALAQQLPQLLGGMGLIGVLAGTAAAALIPLFGSMLGGAEDTKAASEAIDRLNDAIDELNAVNKVYSVEGLDAAVEKYGEINREVLLLIERQRQLVLDKAMTAAKTAVDSLGGSVSNVRGQLEAFDNLMADAADNPVLAADAALWAESIQEEFGLTIDQARALVAAFDTIGQTTSLEGKAAAAADLYGKIEGTKLETEGLRESLLDAESALRALAVSAPAGGWMNAAIGGVQGLIGKLWEAVQANSALEQSNRASGPAENYDRLSANGLSGPDAVRSIDQFSGGQFTPVVTGAGLRSPVVRSSGGSGGGGGQSAQTDAMREAQKIYDETRTEAEKYAVKVAELDGLLGQGAISQDTYNRAIIAAKDSFGELNATQEAFKDGIDAAAGAMADWLTQGKSLREGLADVFAGIASDLAKSAFKDLLNDIFSDVLGEGGGGGGLLGAIISAFTGGGNTPAAPSFAGGGYTGSGPRSGGLDGMGGFRAILHPNETVVDHTRGQKLRGGGGAPVVNIVVNGARGNMEIQDMVQKGVAAGMRETQRQAPDQMAKVQSDPRVRK